VLHFNFKSGKRIIPIRVSKEDELMGLDLAEHGEQADYGIEFEEK